MNLALVASGCIRAGYDSNAVPCAADSCGVDGTCVAGELATRCLCSDGTAADPGACAYSLNLCAGLDCGPQAACAVVDGSAVCRCGSGQVADPLTGCGQANDPCAGQSCDGHGRCGLDDSDQPRCVCDVGYFNEAVLGCTVVPATTGCSADADCVDGDPCTDDRCLGDGTCDYPFNTSPCDDGVFCNGVDACDGLGSCVNHAGDPCVGGAACNDTCDELAGTCFSPSTRACDDGLFCNGADTCDGAGACAHAGDPCAGGAACNDTCDEGTDDCFSPVMTSCDDGTFCNGADTCDGAGGCLLHAGDPCAGGAACNDTCNEGTDDCFSPVTTACDDGAFCNGADTCDDLGGCLVHDGDPCLGGDACNDTCNEGPDDCFSPTTRVCDDSLFCNGGDRCDGVGGCTTHAGDPCVAQACPHCNETARVCSVEGPIGDLTCGDGVDNDCDTLTDSADSSCGGEPTWRSHVAQVAALPQVSVGHVAALLATGDVLIASCNDESTEPPSGASYRYRPASNTWVNTGATVVKAWRQSVATLHDGRVLLAGGYTLLASPYNQIKLAQYYDPRNDSYAAAPSLNVERDSAPALTLPDGRVLVVGGDGLSASPDCLNTAERLDPVAGTWSLSGPMANPRYDFMLTLLGSGVVLAIAGSDCATGATSTVDRYELATNTWSARPALSTAHRRFGGVTLHDDRSLAVSGVSNPVNELLDGDLRSTAPAFAKDKREAAYVLHPSGRPLVVGGVDGNKAVTDVLMYLPASNSWLTLNPMLTGRMRHSAVLLPDGRALMVAGWDNSAKAIASVESVRVWRDQWLTLPDMAATRLNQSATLLADGRLLAVGGEGSDPSSVEAYTPGAASWQARAPLGTGRSAHASVLLEDGRVLVTGGTVTLAISSVEAYDPVANAWTNLPPLAGPRTRHSATALGDGSVLVAGGMDSTSAILATCERKPSGSDTWAATGAMSIPRTQHTATLLADGRVLVAGGATTGASTVTNTAQRYDPSAGTWSNTGALVVARHSHCAVLLPSGEVLVAGGLNASGGALASVEIYAPAAGTWRTVAALPSVIAAPRCALLPTGMALLVGGRTTTTAAVLYEIATDTWLPMTDLPGFQDVATLTVLPSGDAALVGGSNGPSALRTARSYLDNRAAPAAQRPTLNPLAATVARGASLALGGSGFTRGGGTVGVERGASPSNYPLVLMNRAGDPLQAFAPTTAWTATTASATVPASLVPGTYWVRVVVNGASSDARAVRVTP